MKLPHTSLEAKHLPVMINEVRQICDPSKGGDFMDCTFGGGGYSKELLKYKNTNITALDRDKKVLVIAKDLQKKFYPRFSFFNQKFSNLDKVVKKKFDAVIFDLGLSSIQLDDLSRGFSFKSKSDLDMTMGLNDISVKSVLNKLKVEELKLILKKFGDEKEAFKIAKNIVETRALKTINTTNELVQIIKKSKKKNQKKKIDESTKTFQALRIFVNKEITELINGIIKATQVLKPGGKLIIVSFHSLEDKIVKFYFKNFSSNYSRTNKYLPEEREENFPLFENYKNKILVASPKEVRTNFRSRSAKLRVAIRSANEFKDPKELRIKFKHLTDLEKISA